MQGVTPPAFLCLALAKRQGISTQLDSDKSHCQIIIGVQNYSFPVIYANFRGFLMQRE